MKVGSLCEMVDDFEDGVKRICAQLNVCLPVMHNVYVVRSIDTYCGAVYIRLEEIVNQPAPNGIEYCFEIDIFRELQPPMDISELIKQPEPLSI